ncbi:bacteriocin immunity protein [Paenibacillus sp. YAF4_2]|uniref:bacteriocin immunity protein n=1 Tax=Paenibacillus sp. YAF4_2 TaxID=3233085 RepID=UPI003F94F0A3
MKVLIKEELIELVRKIMNVEGSEEEIDNMIELLKSNVPHPEVSDLIYWNEKELTAEQVVEQALSYKPIRL